jgi:acyl dehydratase
MLTISPDADLNALAGTSPGVSSWLQIDQPRIDGFAAVTDDHQWLHVDPVRAADGPYGATIAHGFLVLSLLPSLATEVLQTDGFSSIVNYGLDKVRFPAPVLVGSLIRDRVMIDDVADSKNGLLMTITHTVEIEGLDRPACVARQLRLFTI